MIAAHFTQSECVAADVLIVMDTRSRAENQNILERFARNHSSTFSDTAENMSTILLKMC